MVTTVAQRSFAADPRIMAATAFLYYPPSRIFAAGDGVNCTIAIVVPPVAFQRYTNVRPNLVGFV
jgi:hypothetical protein